MWARAYDETKPDITITEVTDTYVRSDNGPLGPGFSTLAGFLQFVENGDYVLKTDAPS